MAWEILIPIITAGLALLAIGIEYMMHDRDKALKIELAIRQKQRDIKKYQKDKDTKAMMDANKELMSLMGQNMRLRMRMMIISMPLFLVIFWILSGMLSIAPLTAGATSHIGVSLRNLEKSDQSVTAEFFSDGITVIGQNLQNTTLDNNGNSGDRQQVWWNVTSDEGVKGYSIKVTSSNSSENKSYQVAFSQPGSMSAGFSHAGVSNLLSDKIEITPLYNAVDINIAGISMGWYWYYIISYFIFGALFTPLKNYLLWGHRKGVKHHDKQQIQNEAKEK